MGTSTPNTPNTPNTTLQAGTGLDWYVVTNDGRQFGPYKDVLYAGAICCRLHERKFGTIATVTTHPEVRA